MKDLKNTIILQANKYNDSIYNRINVPDLCIDDLCDKVQSEINYMQLKSLKYNVTELISSAINSLISEIRAENDYKAINLAKSGYNYDDEY